VFLVDTNAWLELLLEQEKAGEVREFFQRVEARLLAITEFSLYSVGGYIDPIEKRQPF
jgi:hypothetical protein